MLFAVHLRIHAPFDFESYIGWRNILRSVSQGTIGNWNIPLGECVRTNQNTVSIPKAHGYISISSISLMNIELQREIGNQATSVSSTHDIYARIHKFELSCSSNGRAWASNAKIMGSIPRESKS